MTTLLKRDEREHAVDLAADRLAFLVVCYGALLLAAYRSFALGQESWDLLGLVVLGGAVGLADRLRQRVVTRPWTMVVAATVVLALIVAAIGSVLAQSR
jgi:hypothetical protein